jgi:hypothetical protein
MDILSLVNEFLSRIIKVLSSEKTMTLHWTAPGLWA